MRSLDRTSWIETLSIDKTVFDTVVVKYTDVLPEHIMYSIYVPFVFLTVPEILPIPHLILPEI